MVRRSLILIQFLVGAPLRVSPSLRPPRPAACGVLRYPLQQRGAPGALDLRSRGVAPSQRNLIGMPLRGDENKPRREARNQSCIVHKGSASKFQPSWQLLFVGAPQQKQLSCKSTYLGATQERGVPRTVGPRPGKTTLGSTRRGILLPRILLEFDFY